MIVFEPPTDDLVFPVPFTPESRMGLVSNDEKRQMNLAKYYPTTARGRNVFLLKNGTFTENDPGDPSTVERVYYGAHRTVVTQAEADALTDAGYGDYLEYL